MEKYIMAMDQGTTSSRCILYDRSGRQASMAQKEFRQYYPHEGWVEHDAMEIWSSQLSVAQEAMARINATYENIDCIGITNQRETTVVWDRRTGEPVCRAIVWQCRRTADYCDDLKARGLTDKIRQKTGLMPDAYFSGSKLKWILDHTEGARQAAQRGDLLFGTVESWLIWKLTDGAVHVTDYSNASRTMMFNIHELDWDGELLEILDIPEQMLPQPVPSSSIYGHTSQKIFGAEIPISGAAGDQQAALFGQTCFEKGDVKMTYGTGGFLLMNTGSEPVCSKNGLLSTVAWGLDGKVTYALEGSVFVAGAVIQWLRDELEMLPASPASEGMALSVPDSGGVYIVPAFVGLGAPYWDPYARGSIFGITRGTNKNHLTRAALESIAYQTYDLAVTMTKDIGTELSSFRVDGGASANGFLMQFQADLLGMAIVRPRCIETTSLGAAYLAGLATGYWKDLEDIASNAATDKVFVPEMNDEKREELLAGWHRAIEKTLGWVNIKK